MYSHVVCRVIGRDAEQDDQTDADPTANGALDGNGCLADTLNASAHGQKGARVKVWEGESARCG